MALVGQLKLNCDPFARDGVAPLGPVRAALEQLTRHVELGTAIVLVVGPAGSGKSFLLGLAEEFSRARGISVLRVERGDLAQTVIGKSVDLLLVDEADFVDPATLNFIAGHPETAKTVVFACRTPCSVGDMAVQTLVNLTPLTPNEARDFVVERATAAGRPDLFAPEALESLIAGTSGVPRLLRSVGALALFFADSQGASNVGVEHVAEALDAQAGKSHSSSEIGDAKSLRARFTGAPVARMAAEPEIEREETQPIDVAPAAPGAGQMRLPTPLMIAASNKPASRRRNFVTAKILGAAVLPLLLLSGSRGEAGTATQVSAAMNFVHRASAMDAMRALQRVADAEYPRRMILVVLNPPALQPLRIAPAERTFTAVKKPVAPASQVKAKAKGPPKTKVTER